MNYIAHVRESDKAIQPLKAHLLGVQRLAEQYGLKLGLKHVAGLAGLLHDMGKYSNLFQAYIRAVAIQAESSDQKRGDVDHSTAGGKLLFDLLHGEGRSGYEKLLAEVVGNAIISHHSDLQDFISPDSQSPFLRRVQEKHLPEYDLAVHRFLEDVMPKAKLQEYINLALEELQRFTDRTPTQSFFLCKFIFSCLIDADRTDTRRFEDGEETLKTEGTTGIDDQLQLYDLYYQRLMDHLSDLGTRPDAHKPINLLRAHMSEQCDRFAVRPSGIYTLSIPTGGGKTLASLRYALRHAREYHKQRIIYVVPYTTIIEQNAAEVRKVLQDEEHILEHHSNIIMDVEDKDEETEDGVVTRRAKLKLARDHWDCPVIFTTLVQFLNVIYAKGNRNTRRMHNLMNAVIIFDEVQKVPIHCVSLFNEALNFLKRYGNCSILLCTATQPTLEKVKHSLLKDRDGEIVPNLQEITRAFKRVELVDRTDKPMRNDELADWIRSEIDVWGSTLVILNTRSVVKDLYEKLKEASCPVFHLSTSMCAAHRKNQLQTIRDLLNKQVPFICVTTQLIEAGVDVSFKCVIRSLAGLDSIAQAAGRCNRHGEDEVRNVYVINHAEEILSSEKEILVGKEISGNLFALFQRKADRYDGNLLYQVAMEEYFRYFYNKMDTDLDYYIPELNTRMTRLLMAMNSESSYVTHYYNKHGKRFPLLLSGSYRTAAEYFQVIKDQTEAVIVPYGGGRDIIAQLNSSERIEDISRLLKQAQHYTVNLYPQELRKLKADGAIKDHMDGLILELLDNWYSKAYGIDLKGEGELEFIDIT